MKIRRIRVFHKLLKYAQAACIRRLVRGRPPASNDAVPCIEPDFASLGDPLAVHR